MTPKEFEKMVKDYAENGLPEDSALICLHRGKLSFANIRGVGVRLAATITMAMAHSRYFARLVKLACDFYDDEGSLERAQAAETVSDYLDRMGFKKEE